jgi:hypothetical protein
MKCIPMRCTPVRCTPRKTHAYDIHAYEMHAHGVRAHELQNPSFCGKKIKVSVYRRTRPYSSGIGWMVIRIP